MSKTRFRFIICVYALLVLVVMVLPRSLQIPDSVVEAQKAAGGDATWGRVLLQATAILLFAVLVTGIVGLFVFWRPGRYLFLAGSLGGFVCIKLYDALYVPWEAISMWQGLFGGLKTISMGVLLGVVFLGSSSHLFDGEGSINSVEPTSALSGARGSP